MESAQLAAETARRRPSKRKGAMRVLLSVALVASPSHATTFQHCVHRRSGVAAFVPSSRIRHTNACHPMQPMIASGTSSRCMTNKGDNNDRERDDDSAPSGVDRKRPIKEAPTFMDAMLEIPDPRLFAGDILFILIINFLLQIANDVGDPEFWTNGGFIQPVTMPTTLLEVVSRDSKMSIAWVLAALWNRSYSASAVSDDQAAVKTALQIWIDYCSLRILLELGESFLFTHSSINIWMLGREAWYTAIIMSFFRLAYGRFW